MQELSKSLFNIRGQFYPRDHVVAILPSEKEAREAASALADAGIDSGEILVLSPAEIRFNLTGTAEESDRPLPSPGTEAETSRKFVDLADEGHWALLIHSKRSEEDELIVKALTESHAVLAERYRMLVIEDLMQDVRLI